jgi:3-hydroxyacyl-[acyl-carrier-protein] dehydratase
MLVERGFYKVEEICQGEHPVVKISLNPADKIYEGHFPGTPVAPGVCLVEIIREIMSDLTGRELRLKEAGNIKFMAIVNPNFNPVLHIACNYKSNERDEIVSRNQIYFGETVFMKFDGLFV